jgi:glycosyltransferase involved in cell wall biosynthesis
VKASNARTGLTSIIIPCWNQREITRYCIAALKRHTRRPWELIVVDNGSTDGTANYLAGVQDAAAVPVTVIANTTNRGFPAAINQGLKVARGEYVVLLNNDVVVTDGWLDQLVALATAKLGVDNNLTAKRAKDAKEQTEERAESDCDRVPENGTGGSTTIARAVDGGAQPAEEENPHDGGGLPSLPTAYCLPRTPRKSIGLVGPMSNYASPPQLVESVPYHDLRAMHEFARRWRDQNRGSGLPSASSRGFAC